MSDILSVTKRDLCLSVGGENLNISFDKGDDRFPDLTELILKDYQVPIQKDGCHIRIVPYFHSYKYKWPSFFLEQFGFFCDSVEKRYPVNKMAGVLTRRSISVLQYLDPADENVQQVFLWVDDPDTLAWAQMGNDLYLYNSKCNSAFLFIKRRIRKSHIQGAIMNGIMFVLSNVLVYNKGIMLHGSAVQKEDQGWLFLGHSGAGKTTITRLLRPDFCFSDDGVIIKEDKGRIYAYVSPFNQLKRQRHCDPRAVERGEIKGLFLLKKDMHIKFSPVRKNELMSVLVCWLIHFFKYMDMRTAHKAFLNARDLISIIPSCRLHFTKSRKVWHEFHKLTREIGYE